MHHDHGVTRNSVGDEHPLDRLGNRDDPVGTAPGAEPTDVKLDAARGDDRPALRDGRDQRERVAIVDVDDVRLECGDGAAQVPPGARIQTDLPGGAKDVDAGRGAALRELAALLGDERLLDLDIAPELAGEQPDLLLAAAPVAARIDL